MIYVGCKYIINAENKIHPEMDLDFVKNMLFAICEPLIEFVIPWNMIDILELIINELLISISYQSRCKNCHRFCRYVCHLVYVCRIEFSIQHAYA